MQKVMQSIGRAEAWVIDRWPGLAIRILVWPIVFLLTWVDGSIYNPVTRSWVVVFPTLRSWFSCFDDTPGPNPLVPITLMFDMVIVGSVWMLWLLVFVILRWWMLAVLAAIVVPWFFWCCLKKYREK